MKQLQEYIPVERIVPVDTVHREEILQQLIRTALPTAPTELHTRVFQDITGLSRRKETSMGKGFFLVHTRTPEITEISVSVGLLGREIKYRRGEKAHTVFCIVVPDSMPRVYLCLMARLARMLSLPATREVFLKREPRAIVELIREFERVEPLTQE